MRWTHHAESADTALDEQMWQILTAETPAQRGARDLSVRTGLYLFAGAVPIVAWFVWLVAYVFGLGVR